MYKKKPTVAKLKTTPNPIRNNADSLIPMSTTTANTTPANISFDISRQ